MGQCMSCDKFDNSNTTFTELQKLACTCGQLCHDCGKWLTRNPKGHTVRCDACREERQMSRAAISGMREMRKR